MIGKVKWWSDAKGYGFLIGSSEKDVFVHYSQIRGRGFKTLSPEKTYQYDLVETPKGLSARNVEEVDES